MGRRPFRFHIPFERLDPIERLIIVARDLFGITNEEIAKALTELPHVIAKRLNIPIGDVPPIPAHWHGSDLANTGSKTHGTAWMKLTLWIFGEVAVSELRFKVVWARWISGHGPIRVAREVGPDPDCAARSRCNRGLWARNFGSARMECGPEEKRSVLKCLQMVISEPCLCWSATGFNDLECALQKGVKARSECLKDLSECRIAEIEAAAARAIRSEMDEDV